MLWSFKKFKEEFNQVPIHALLFHIVQEGVQPGIKDEKNINGNFTYKHVFCAHNILTVVTLQQLSASSSKSGQPGKR